MATSAKQIAANRANAKRSTGPRTAAGKQQSSKNAVTHGILSRALVVGNEDPAEFQTLLNSLLDDLQPEGANEQLLVEKMSVALWRMKRLNAVETATIKQAQMTISAEYACKPDHDKAGLGIALTMRAIPANSQQFMRYQAHAEAQYYRAMTMLRSLQDRRADRMAIDVSAKQIGLGS